jgi:murein DD-endopeptidase MepM/ murein hydrolase activator NlpD
MFYHQPCRTAPSYMGHLGIIAVKEGDVVSPGTIVSVVIKIPGRSTGPHLPYPGRKNWLMVNGSLSDPEPFIKH